MRLRSVVLLLGTVSLMGAGFALRPSAQPSAVKGFGVRADNPPPAAKSAEPAGQELPQITVHAAPT